MSPERAWDDHRNAALDFPLTIETDHMDRHVASLPPGVMAFDNGPASAERASDEPVIHVPEETPAPASPGTSGLNGVPAHTGSRPPSFHPYPLRSPSLRDGDEFAAFSPHVLLDGCTTGQLTVRAASVRGDSHNWEGSCRQDAMVVTRIGPPEAEMLLLAVADGVGSARYSHIGSHRAARLAAVQLDGEAVHMHADLCAQDGTELAALANKAIANAVGDGWNRTAERGGRPYDDADYATTLQVLLVPTDARIRERALLSVGDGGLHVLRDGVWSQDDPVDAGVLDTRTEALPHAYSSVKTRVFRTEPGEVLLLGTDGITNPLTQKDPEFAQRLADAWGTAGVPSLSDFLWQAQLRAKSYDDDRTVVCLWEESA